MLAALYFFSLPAPRVHRRAGCSEAEDSPWKEVDLLCKLVGKVVVVGGRGQHSPAAQRRLAANNMGSKTARED